MIKTFKKETLFEGLFFLAFILFLISAMIETTTFSDYPFLLHLSWHLRKAAWCIGILKIFLQAIAELRSGQKKIDWFNIAFAGAMVICYFFSHAHTIVHIMVFILAAKGISFKKIAAWTFAIQGSWLILTICAYLSDLITGIDYTPPGEATCYSLGYNSPNCLILIAFQLIFLYGYLRKEKIRWFEFLLLGGFATIFYRISQGRIGFACILLFLAALALYRYKWIHKVLLHLRFLIKPFATLLCIAFLVLTFLYPRPPMDTINQFTTNRLKLTSEAFEEYGITPFGQPIHWIGQRGKTTGPNSNYNYVDSSYAKALLDYGVIPLLLFLYIFYKKKSFLYQKENTLLLLLILIIELYCFFDSFLLTPVHNTTLFLLKDLLYPLKEEGHSVQKGIKNEEI